MKTFTLKIEKIRKETEDTYTFCFKQPGLKKIKYLAGQYLTVIVNINGRKYRRPYSFSSSPGIENTLDITVKRVPNGIVSNHLIDVVKENDLIEVMEPMGSFIYDDEIQKGQDVYLWGAGSGVTPLMSIIKFILHHHSNNVYFTYCNKTISDTIFYEQLCDLEKAFPAFRLRLFCTKELNKFSKNSRISEEDVREIIINSAYRGSSSHYICGPDGLKNNVERVLLHQGFTSSNVFTEDFENIVDEEQLADIKTESVELILKDVVNVVEVTKGKSILEAALDFGLDIAYSCQTGTCHLCKAKLNAGEVKIISNEYDPSGLLTGEYLLCCSYPLTDNVNFKLE